MQDKIKEQLDEYDRLYRAQDDFYSKAAQYAGLSSAAHLVLYRLYGEQESLIQSDLCREWHFSKQTVNSAVNKLVAMGLVELKSASGTGHRKVVTLTKAGEVFSEKNIKPVLDAERAAFEEFTEEERKMMLHLMKKQIDAMNRHVEDLWS